MTPLQFQVMSTKVFTVSKLNQEIRLLLETNFRSIAVQGEISNLKHQSSGHFYFSLKDKDSQISSVLFRGHAQQLSKPLKEGDQIIIYGELGVYTPRGTYQIIARKIEFVGDGELLLKLHRYKEELKAKGWLDLTHKKKLPKYPKKIGLITSPTGAVIQDILHVLSRRFSGFNVLLNPVKVQGTGAAEEIAKAIAEMNRYHLVDVLIIGRGGGSIEDLWAFNEPIVAEAIFHSKIPIISAVGHETDYSISDLVADVRAPTPSAAAEIVTKEKKQLIEYLTSVQSQILRSITANINHAKAQLKGVKNHPALSSPYYLLGKQMQKIDELKNALQRQFKNNLQNYRLKLDSLCKRKQALQPGEKIVQFREKLKSYSKSLSVALHYQMQSKKQHLIEVQKQIRSLHPKKLLKSGYSLLYSKQDQSLIFSIDQIKKGEKIIAEVYDGKFEADISEIRRSNERKDSIF